MLDREPNAAGLLGVINARHRTDFRLRSRFRGGENHGAYAIVSADGSRFVLKRQRAAPDASRRLTRADGITRRLQTLGYPAPLYLLVGTTPEGELYCVEELLPGEPVDRVTERPHLDRLVELNDLQAGQAMSSEQNWSIYASQVVFEDASGWRAVLRSYSPGTAHLAQALERLTAGRDGVGSAGADIVHGDLSPGNILVHQGHISGVVDWDAAGCGDRAFDLALLLFYHFDDPRMCEPLRARVLDLCGFDALCVYLSYTILGQIAWSIGHHGKPAVDHWLRLAGLILDDLRRPAPFR